MKMTYVELCQLIESGEQPEKITIEDEEYVWNGHDYVRLSGDIHSDFFLDDLVNRMEIIVKENVLTDEERDYLKTVIKPFRYKINSITKRRVGCVEFIVMNCDTDGDNDEAVLPSFPKGSTYKNMEPNKDYTLEELEL